MENSLIASTDSILSLFAVVLVTGMTFGKLSGIVKLPDVVLFLMGGIILGPYVLNLVGTDVSPIGNHLLLTFGSAFILYDGGREIRLKVLNSVKITVGLLAIIGLAISAVLTGYAVQEVFNINMLYALLLGAVIASTDPATLVPVFKCITLREKVKQTVISESAFNDAAGAILVFSIIATIQNGTFSLGGSIKQLGIMMAGGILVGVAVGMVLSHVISDKKFGFLHEYAPLVSIFAVIISYILAEKFHGSGYMAAFVTGLVCGNKSTFGLVVPPSSSLVQTHVRETLSTLMRMSIFIMLGTQVDFVALAMYWKQSLLIVFLLMFVFRPLSVLVCTLPDRKAKWTFREILFLMWVRETGVIPAALSGMIVSMHLPHSDVISSVVFMTILITLTVQASTTKIFAKSLDLLEDESCLAQSNYALEKLI
ncbi:cell volume regulation protein A (plasmid) [Peptoclostridium acidaminophilum DSM 3953]|uniref:Cell volume regulation protein A n=1 Tax=Peptoclostridium acidaminophilum DSM 3953 TaxID=1286171 RepID=W8UB38_PEPAC|nr:cation:proton antiporter [Peptoclostridium acidaminophilum]AHM58001.1 cell volume regulation protein A [Peptoclostridium acidaminophilum DSM 3953]